MKRDYRTSFGVLLIAGGVLLGLQQFGYLQGSWNDAVFAGLWFLGALYFFDLYRNDTNQWWFGLVAFVFAGLAASNILSLVFPAIGDAIGGGLFLGAIGVGFIIAYRRSSDNWWALIPAGVMFSLAAIAVINALNLELPFDTGGLLFLGLGFTFLLISQITVSGERMSWGVFPAIPLLILGVFVSFGQAASWSYIWPVLIILFGLYFLANALRKR